ncbi:hypothetical protein BpHYR1_011035 [Brachionus plicatilis]|uniref:Uncharacterized protein n=1 Tax=Brachionus plicatilis TaxID=10195 RepID=A0A3M7QQW8_BRAPC|nr:hypothetical protein BpHYR1_011035 [Brachionus plicatilis]
MLIFFLKINFKKKIFGSLKYFVGFLAMKNGNYEPVLWFLMRKKNKNYFMLLAFNGKIILLEKNLPENKLRLVVKNVVLENFLNTLTKQNLFFLFQKNLCKFYLPVYPMTDQ